MGFTPVFVRAGTKAKDTLDQLGDSVEAVYLTPPLRMSRPETQTLINGINSKKIPSFSLRGLPDVEKGVLAGIALPTADRCPDCKRNY